MSATGIRRIRDKIPTRRAASVRRRRNIGRPSRGEGGGPLGRGEDRAFERGVGVVAAARVAHDAGGVLEPTAAPRLEDPAPGDRVEFFFSGGGDSLRGGGKAGARVGSRVSTGGGGLGRGFGGLREVRGFRSSRGDRGAAAARGDVDSVSRSGAISKRRVLGRGAGGRGDTHSRQYWWTLERSSLHAHGVGRKNSSEPFASHVVSQQMRHTGAAREAEEEEACIAPGARAATDDGRGAGGTSARGVRPESERRADPRRVDGRAVNGRGPTPRAPARVRAGERPSLRAVAPREAGRG